MSSSLSLRARLGTWIESAPIQRLIIALIVLNALDRKSVV